MPNSHIFYQPHSQIYIFILLIIYFLITVKSYVFEHNYDLLKKISLPITVGFYHFTDRPITTPPTTPQKAFCLSLRLLTTCCCFTFSLNLYNNFDDVKLDAPIYYERIEYFSLFSENIFENIYLTF